MDKGVSLHVKVVCHFGVIQTIISQENIPNTLDVSTPVLIPSVVASLDRHSVSISKLKL